MPIFNIRNSAIIGMNLYEPLIYLTLIESKLDYN